MSNTNITTTTETTTVVVEENIVRIELNNIGVQGVPGANNDPVYVTVRNATGSLITKGSIVYVSGGNGTHTQVTKALATSDATSARVLGWLAADIANNADGLCMVEGYLDGVDTQGVTEGAQLYLSGTTAGAYQVTKPVAPIHLVYVGVAVKASAGNGRVYVKVQNGYELNELHDVLITAPTNNQVLAYDSATQLWKNAVNAPDGVTSITATAPLTGGTITSTGSIGLDQTALSITKSQVSDFTSGTVTSASTAQQAGTAVYAVNAGTAVYSTTAGTAVYSANSGTAVTISGTITRSQVSDFTSGTVAQADNATTSGTATFATNSGTAVFATTSGTATTISGDITKSQVSDFTSGTVASAGTAQQSGTAVFANTSGTATFATTSGTATYATNSGTAVFATNASTAVSVSGSAITQSQVVNLVSDLANTAKLNTANTFSVGGHVINNSGTAIVPLQINGVSGQSGDLVQIRDNSGNNNLSVSATYGLVGRNAGNLAFALSSASGIGAFYSQAAGNVPLLARGASGQTASMFQFQNDAGSITANFTAPVNNVNRLNLGGTDLSATLGITVHASGGVGQVIRGAASQSANLLEIQSSAAAVLLSVTSAGNLNAPGQVRVGTTSGLAQLSVVSTNAATIAQVVRGAASQSVDLLQLQNSAGTNQFRVDQGGMTVTNSLGVAGSPSGISYAYFTTPAANAVPVVVRGAASQTANLQSWQSSAAANLATVDSSGNVRGNSVRTNSDFTSLLEANSGGYVRMTRQTAATPNPGANLGSLYFRDGTNAGTLKLVVRAGAAGAETTILDNIPT
jgi:hypothetical protein